LQGSTKKAIFSSAPLDQRVSIRKNLQPLLVKYYKLSHLPIPIAYKFLLVTMVKEEAVALPARSASSIPPPLLLAHTPLKTAK